MKRPFASLLGPALAAGLVATRAFAVVSIDFVTVGDPGNAGDSLEMEIDGSSGYGAVSTSYQIARNETTIAQYVDFLNAVAATDTHGLYSPDMGMEIVAGIHRSGSPGAYSYTAAPGSGNRPVTFVSWFDAARYCNWLHNGQASGLQGASTTEDGAYTLNGLESGVAVSRNVSASIWIPSENEWYKAAYYDPMKNGGAGGYWLHPNRGDAAGGNTVGDPSASNYFDGDYVGYPGQSLTDVGAYGSGSASAYGTNDQGGNVFEWNDAVIGGSRGLRGGSWDFSDQYMSAAIRYDYEPTEQSHNVGFRVASLVGVSVVPEPAVIATSAFLSLMLLLRRRR